MSRSAPYQPLLLRILHGVSGILVIAAIITGFLVYNTYDRQIWEITNSCNWAKFKTFTALWRYFSCLYCQFLPSIAFMLGKTSPTTRFFTAT